MQDVPYVWDVQPNRFDSLGASDSQRQAAIIISGEYWSDRSESEEVGSRAAHQPVHDIAGSAGEVARTPCRTATIACLFST